MAIHPLARLQPPPPIHPPLLITLPHLPFCHPYRTLLSEKPLHPELIFPLISLLEANHEVDKPDTKRRGLALAEIRMSSRFRDSHNLHNVDPHHSRAVRPPSPLPPLSCLFGTLSRTENRCTPPQTPPESTVSPSPSPRLEDHRDGRAHSAPPINILAATADDGGQERYDSASEWTVGREPSPSGFVDHSDPSDIGPHSAVQEPHVRQLRPRAATATVSPSYILASPRAISAAISLSEIKKRPRSQEIVKSKPERAPKRRRRN
ncbi:hypothetical protein SISNIDRAFT_490311 [Sistotremastrum niveocremeum HHB9708]|uniref:Uncharacterized protein n=1 Tax=Sistotremastrum niveocremeum HHB9708 TaxID=1314777 RepID=A0A164P2U0_9AGAM|nr:hypothetical protein SISNIDRAFT_490311 [Sistotremastrum niveocremeum HHB9708]